MGPKPFHKVVSASLTRRFPEALAVAGDNVGLTIGARRARIAVRPPCDDARSCFARRRRGFRISTPPRVFVRLADTLREVERGACALILLCVDLTEQVAACEPSPLGARARVAAARRGSLAAPTPARSGCVRPRLTRRPAHHPPATLRL
jgi:hypothetical protein